MKMVHRASVGQSAPFEASLVRTPDSVIVIGRGRFEGFPGTASVKNERNPDVAELSSSSYS